MNPSPGHRQWPDHRVQEHPLDTRMRVRIGDEAIADSAGVIRVDEDQHPARWYFPRSEVAMARLRRSSTTTECPFKGTAHYFDIEMGGKRLADAAWSYEDPYDEHRALKDRVAFDDGKFPEIRIGASP